MLLDIHKWNYCKHQFQFINNKIQSKDSGFIIFKSITTFMITILKFTSFLHKITYTRIYIRTYSCIYCRDMYPPMRANTKQLSGNDQNLGPSSKSKQSRGISNSCFETQLRYGVGPTIATTPIIVVGVSNVMMTFDV